MQYEHRSLTHVHSLTPMSDTSCPYSNCSRKFK